MSAGVQFDDETTRQVVAAYETEDAAQRREAVRQALQLKPGERVIDIGTGPGFLAREMADAVGPGGHIQGVDTSEPMLKHAATRCADRPWVRLERADATRLPVPNASFDAAVSVQVLEYVAEIETALAEMFRVLKPGGRAVVVATDWDSVLWHSVDVGRMKRVLKAFEGHCAFTNLPRTLGPKLVRAGFSSLRHGLVAQFNTTLSEQRFSRHLIRFVTSFVPGRHGIARAQVEAWANELLELSERGEYFFCLNQFLFRAEKPPGPSGAQHFRATTLR